MRDGCQREIVPTDCFPLWAHIRSRPEYQKPHLDVVAGKVESHTMSWRFGLVQQATNLLQARSGLT